MPHSLESADAAMRAAAGIRRFDDTVAERRLTSPPTDRGTASSLTLGRILTTLQGTNLTPEDADQIIAAVHARTTLPSCTTNG